MKLQDRLKCQWISGEPPPGRIIRPILNQIGDIECHCETRWLQICASDIIISNELPFQVIVVLSLLDPCNLYSSRTHVFSLAALAFGEGEGGSSSTTCPAGAAQYNHSLAAPLVEINDRASSSTCLPGPSLKQLSSVHHSTVATFTWKEATSFSSLPSRI